MRQLWAPFSLSIISIVKILLPFTDAKHFLQQLSDGGSRAIHGAQHGRTGDTRGRGHDAGGGADGARPAHAAGGAENK